MIQLELEPALEAEIAAEATARGLDVDHYLITVIETRLNLQRRIFDPAAFDKAVQGMHEIRSRSRPGPESMKDLIEEGRKY